MTYNVFGGTLNLAQSIKSASCRRTEFCLSVSRTRDLRQNGRKICPDFCTIRKIVQPSFLRKRMVGAMRTEHHQLM